MSKTLLLMAQGKADRKVANEPVSGPAGQKLLPLHNAGKRRAQRMGLWLARHAYVPDTILVSPAPRATLTAEKAIKVMGLGVERIHIDERLYRADFPALLERLHALPEFAETVLLVGHKQGLEQLIRYFTRDERVSGSNKQQLLKPGSLAVLKLDEVKTDETEPDVTWAKQGACTATMCELIHTSLLPDLFPWPNLNSSELRKRPAYYYCQSSVIPYRFNGQGLKILLIRSSKQSHWIVPKGIHEPGLSSQESAAKEAWEEAGIEGEVGAQLLGSYRYEKWGSVCEVSVYPMRVESMVEEDQWLESHRGRAWFSPEEAMGLLKQQSLIPMLQQLVANLNRSTNIEAVA